jgi:hypothetical protein
MTEKNKTTNESTTNEQEQVKDKPEGAVPGAPSNPPSMPGHPATEAYEESQGNVKAEESKSEGEEEKENTDSEK